MNLFRVWSCYCTWIPKRYIFSDEISWFGPSINSLRSKRKECNAKRYNSNCKQQENKHQDIAIYYWNGLKIIHPTNIWMFKKKNQKKKEKELNHDMFWSGIGIGGVGAAEPPLPRGSRLRQRRILGRERRLVDAETRRIPTSPFLVPGPVEDHRILARGCRIIDIPWSKLRQCFIRHIQGRKNE